MKSEWWRDNKIDQASDSTVSRDLFFRIAANSTMRQFTQNSVPSKNSEIRMLFNGLELYSRESNLYNFDPSVILEPKLSSCQNKSPFPIKRLHQRRSDGPFPIIRHQPSQNDGTFTLYFRVECGLSKKWIERVESIRYIAEEINS